ncbi:MAG: transglycosylase domain-containing protein [Chitinispirillaceae bacterium]|nr:transglycosylase domain-containing protein [Chitinispirillaceae bacterium]
MKKKMRKKRSFLKILLIIALFFLGIIIVGAYPIYLVAECAFTRYIDGWGERLAALEKRDLLSKEFGAGWQDVLTGESMEKEARRITENGGADSSGQIQIVDGIALKDYPSLSIIKRLREIREYSNTIEITDRNGAQLAIIKTDHRRARIHEFPQTLITALIAAEDKNFRENNHGFEFSSFSRAAYRSVLGAVLSFRQQRIRGTSTITQQVAKLFISKLDDAGQRHVSRSIQRKLRELKLASAIRKLYGPDDILEVYCNHCVTSDYGLIGYKDIADGLLGKELSDLTDAECIYLARMVKWGRNVRKKITAQCRIDMPRMGEALNWNTQKQQQVLREIDSLVFIRPKRVDAVYGSLVDLANEFWLLTLRQNGFSSDRISSMDLINANSLIRKKGNLKITLTVDAGLQKALETLVNNRGYGPDTTIFHEVPVAKKTDEVNRDTPPLDTVLARRVLRTSIDLGKKSPVTSLSPGDTVLVTVRYKKTGGNRYRRTETFYFRQPHLVTGQYFAYAAMDSRTGELLAYYSKDKLGSRLSCLLKNRTPNGSSTAKPIFNALCFDLGIFKPYDRWDDNREVFEDVAWKRKFEYRRGKPVGVIFSKTAVRKKGYKVHNHDYIFEGCNYIFDLLATSNNIFGVETAYRLDRDLFDVSGEIAADAFPLVQFCYRIGSFQRIKDSLRIKHLTGVRVYKEIVRIVGIDCDSIAEAGNRAMASDSMYSVALGTLELSLYEQLHLFNMLYNNDLIERPASHPSLVIKSIVLNGDTVTLADTVMRYHPFADINNIRPTWLGLYKRLVSNPADGLREYDIPWSGRTVLSAYDDEEGFDPEAFVPDGPVSNYAKSGTSDDVITPFNAKHGSEKRTNYGLWNAVIRIDLGTLSGGTDGSDLRDVTIACIGECNHHYTGARDGKTLHKFVSAGLLKKAGSKSPGGFYNKYETYLRSLPPDVTACGAAEASSPDFGSVLDSRGD